MAKQKLSVCKACVEPSHVYEHPYTRGMSGVDNSKPGSGVNWPVVLLSTSILTGLAWLVASNRGKKPAEVLHGSLSRLGVIVMIEGAIAITAGAVLWGTTQTLLPKCEDKKK